MNFIQLLREKLKRQGNSSLREFDVSKYLIRNEISPWKNKKKEEITLVSKHWSPGMSFIFNGKSSKCKGCRIVGACMNLEKERLYEIQSVKDIEHDCQLTGEKVVTSFVKEPSTLLATKDMVYEGANFTYSDPTFVCDNIFCRNRSLCYPEYYQNGDKLKVLKRIGTARNCNEDIKKDLQIIEVIRI